MTSFCLSGEWLRKLPNNRQRDVLLYKQHEDNNRWKPKSVNKTDIDMIKNKIFIANWKLIYAMRPLSDEIRKKINVVFLKINENNIQRQYNLENRK